MGLGLGLGTLLQQGDRLEVLLGGVEVTGHDLQLADGVEQGRNFVPFTIGQGTVTGHQLLDQLPLVVVADREAVAGPQFAALELVLLQELRHVAADLPDLLALPLHLFLQVEDGAVSFDHDRQDFAEQNFQPLGLLLEEGVEGGEALFLGLAQAFELGEGQPLEELRVFFDGTAKEVADADDE